MITKSLKPTMIPTTISQHSVLGVDPGFSGALALVSAIPNNTNSYTIHEMIDIPTYREEPSKAKIKQNKKGSLQVDHHKLAFMVDEISKEVDLSVIEKVGSMPGQGLSSTFRFGHTTGLITGVIASNYIPTYLVSPQVWKLSMGVTSSKESSIILANKLFKNEIDQSLWRLKKHHDRAEAALMAVYGLMHLKKILNLIKKTKTAI